MKRVAWLLFLAGCAEQSAYTPPPRRECPAGTFETADGTGTHCAAPQKYATPPPPAEDPDHYATISGTAGPDTASSVGDRLFTQPVASNMVRCDSFRVPSDTGRRYRIGCRGEVGASSTEVQAQFHRHAAHFCGQLAYRVLTPDSELVHAEAQEGHRWDRVAEGTRYMADGAVECNPPPG